MPQDKSENRVKYSIAKKLLEGLLQQGLIDQKTFYEADRLNALECK